MHGFSCPSFSICLSMVCGHSEREGTVERLRVVVRCGGYTSSRFLYTSPCVVCMDLSAIDSFWACFGMVCGLGGREGAVEKGFALLREVKGYTHKHIGPRQVSAHFTLHSMH